jgi:hypothetical protein
VEGSGRSWNLPEEAEETARNISIAELLREIETRDL